MNQADQADIEGMKRTKEGYNPEDPIHLTLILATRDHVELEARPLEIFAGGAEGRVPMGA